MSFFPMAESRKGSLCMVCEMNLCDVISPFARVAFYYAVDREGSKLVAAYAENRPKIRE